MVQVLRFLEREDHSVSQLAHDLVVNTRGPLIYQNNDQVKFAQARRSSSKTNIPESITALPGSLKLITSLGLEQVVEPVKRTGLKVVLLFSSSEPNFQHVVELIGRKSSENNDILEVCDTRSLASSDEVHFLNDIRMIPPQVHGQIRSGGGRTLPISNSGKLNRSIPIVIFYDGPKPVDVYPKDLKGIIYDLGSAFNNPGATNVLGVEECITAILSSRPQILGSDMKQIESEFDSESGVVDLVFKDSNGLYMIVEVKETADQETVGQILKQSNGMKSKLGFREMRSAIVALGTSGNVQHACQEAGVELYLITATKQV